MHIALPSAAGGSTSAILHWAAIFSRTGTRGESRRACRVR